MIRKARMDAGLQIKELAEILGVTADTVINWESQNNFPRGDNLRRVVEFIDSNQPEPIPRKQMWELCFSENPAYPSHPKTFGEKLRAARMQKFMTISQAAQELGVNECTVARWESKGTSPSQDMLERVQAFLAEFSSVQ